MLCISSNIFYWETKFGFYVDHMALVSGSIVRWLLLLLKYEFTIIYKLGKTHVIANALPRLLNNSELMGVPYQITDVSLFFIESIWM
jgi:hypothetical protein